MHDAVASPSRRLRATRAWLSQPLPFLGGPPIFFHAGRRDGLDEAARNAHVRALRSVSLFALDTQRHTLLLARCACACACACLFARVSAPARSLLPCPSLRLRCVRLRTRVETAFVCQRARRRPAHACARAPTGRAGAAAAAANPGRRAAAGGKGEVPQGARGASRRPERAAAPLAYAVAPPSLKKRDGGTVLLPLALRDGGRLGLGPSQGLGSRLFVPWVSVCPACCASASACLSFAVRPPIRLLGCRSVRPPDRPSDSVGGRR